MRPEKAMCSAPRVRKGCVCQRRSAACVWLAEDPSSASPDTSLFARCCASCWGVPSCRPPHTGLHRHSWLCTSVSVARQLAFALPPHRALLLEIPWPYSELFSMLLLNCMHFASVLRFPASPISPSRAPGCPTVWKHVHAQGIGVCHRQSRQRHPVPARAGRTADGDHNATSGVLGRLQVTKGEVSLNTAGLAAPSN